ncbi:MULTISPECIES: AAA family ATPase [unclassified Pseudoalteromonas]|uniref:AAA family ATPase n=1 Tax=unclassified Pseudoalteromonas TaxID=194690 RepID=UPI0013FD43B1|nr:MULTISPECIES: AAA family ATPase [unclassified Pseudoalteromonas]
MIQSEFQRFLQTLLSSPSSASVHKFANLVLKNLDEIVPLSTYQGQRVKHVAKLAQKEWASLSQDIPTNLEDVESDVASFTLLKELSVDSFRGFSREETFDLNSLLVLIFGPNGTGKSSFCEALEYALLGSVAEAESKRFRDVEAYLKNAHTNKFAPPKLIGIDAEGSDVNIKPNDALYRFCFVEKNRIDSFSRIAAQAPAKQSELISTLFGLDAFNEFVKNFSLEMDGKHIDVEGIKAKKLSEKRLQLQGAEQQIKLNQSIVEQVKGEETSLATRYREGCTLLQMMFELIGSEERQGQIPLLEAELQKPAPQKSNLTASNLASIKQTLVNSLSDHKQKREELANASQQVSFQQLFEAVTQVQQISPEKCPACLTPLTEVTVNPFTHAGEELAKLQHLAELQIKIRQLEQTVLQKLQELHQILSTCLNFYPTDNKLAQFKLADMSQLNVAWWKSLHAALGDGTSAIQHIDTQVDYLEKQDTKSVQIEQNKKAQQQELNRLKGFLNEAQKLAASKGAAINAIKGAQKLISEFDEANKALIGEVEQEKPIVEQNIDIRESYQQFVTLLNAYRKKLPALLVENLGDEVVKLYNAFNRNDAPTELLASIQLPLAQNQKLKISYQNEPQKYFDALHVLSEGHIRCVGLAILLAKNIKEDCPLLIFDDPVNAIDDDHRQSIRRTLFEDDYFDEKQIILTCHGEEFFKDIQNQLSVEQIKSSQRLAFLPRIDEPHIQVDFKCAPRNYIEGALEHFRKNELRFALGKSRQALESLTTGRVWQYVSKHGDGNLSIKLRAANAPIGLRQLTEQLKTKIKKGDFTDAEKHNVLSPIEQLLGINGDSLEWRYLNKGTHDEVDRAEFERNSVHTIVSALALLDQAL